MYDFSASYIAIAVIGGSLLIGAFVGLTIVAMT
jgi:hypothetical protein